MAGRVFTAEETLGSSGLEWELACPTLTVYRVGCVRYVAWGSGLSSAAFSVVAVVFGGLVMPPLRLAELL